MRRVAKLVNLSYAHEQGYYGQGIVVAVVDSGIEMHRDFRYQINKIESPDGGNQRLAAAVDMVNGRNDFYDDNGHGTHISGIVGGYGPAFVGMAPACKFVSVKVLDRYGNGKINTVLQGLDWILENKDRYNIRIVNISVGTPADKQYDEQSKLVRKVDELWNSGLIVLAAAGNNGPGRRSIGAPGISRKIITVGASDDNNACNDRKAGLVTNSSGRGPPISCIKQHAVVAPGRGVYSCSNLPGRNRYSVKSGTSMSTPVVAGAVALLLSKYPDMTNREVKIRIKNTVQDLGLPHDKQGWGMLDVKTLIGPDY